MNKPIETIDELANRRQYFRVDDLVSIEWAPMVAEQHPAEFFDLNPEFGLMSEFQLLDVESKHLLRTLTDKDKNLGQYLRVMNRKLDALARVIALGHADTTKESIKDVNLSEGGLAFPCDQPLASGAAIALKLILLPSYSGLLLGGRVLSCQGDGPPFQIHVEFIDISEAHQQLLARHIMRKQSQLKHSL